MRGAHAPMSCDCGAAVPARVRGAHAPHARLSQLHAHTLQALLRPLHLRNKKVRPAVRLKAEMRCGCQAAGRGEPVHVHGAAPVCSSACQASRRSRPRLLNLTRATPPQAGIHVLLGQPSGKLRQQVLQEMVQSRSPLRFGQSSPARLGSAQQPAEGEAPGAGGPEVADSSEQPSVLAARSARHQVLSRTVVLLTCEQPLSLDGSDKVRAVCALQHPCCGCSC